MPLLDHFHAPINKRVPWEAVHAGWATRLADLLNEQWLSSEFLAAESTQATHVEIDVAAFEFSGQELDRGTNGPAVAALPRTYAPPQPAETLPAVFPENFEVRIYQSNGFTVVGAIELISPGNKDRPSERQAFATRCASYLYQGISLIIIDIVTSRRANLHNEIMKLMDQKYILPTDMNLYAVAYRPALRNERPEIDVWVQACTLGAPLPTMPLRLKGDLFIPVEFEAAYQETCRKRRLT